jgi:hypothetical protein
MPDTVPIQHCLLRLQKAKVALSRLEATTDRAEIESAWSDLLLAASGIYSKLEQASKVSGKPKTWFGLKKKERKDDPLLSYAHHARNSDEHGIENIISVKEKGSATIRFREPYDPKKLEGLQISVGKDNRGNVVVTSSNEDVASTKMYDTTQVVLDDVKDNRYGDTFQPPYEHLGQKVENQTPKDVGRLLVAYLETLIDSARLIGI